MPTKKTRTAPICRRSFRGGGAKCEVSVPMAIEDGDFRRGLLEVLTAEKLVPDVTMPQMFSPTANSGARRPGRPKKQSNNIQKAANVKAREKRVQEIGESQLAARERFVAAAQGLEVRLARDPPTPLMVGPLVLGGGGKRPRENLVTRVDAAGWRALDGAWSERAKRLWNDELTRQHAKGTEATTTPAGDRAYNMAAASHCGIEPSVVAACWAAWQKIRLKRVVESWTARIGEAKSRKVKWYNSVVKKKKRKRE